jgi:predicted neutral ceramidase superfamily lipid hydrolase
MQNELTAERIEEALHYLVPIYDSAHLDGYKRNLGTALAALRAKQERNKGCEYCQQGEEMAYGQDSMKRTAYIYLDGNLLTADLYSESMAVAVCYCPMCGKRLGDKT